RVAGDSTRRFDYFANAEALPIAQVEDEPVVDLKRIERQQVGLGKIGDVDVVTDTGPIRSGVVLSINTDGLAAAERDVENQGNEVGLRLVRFAPRHAARPLGSAGDIEVAKRCIAQPVD